MKFAVLISSTFLFAMASSNSLSAPVPKQRPIERIILYVGHKFQFSLPDREGLALIEWNVDSLAPPEERNEIYVKVGTDSGKVSTFYPRSPGKLTETKWYPMKKGTTVTIENNTRRKWKARVFFYPGVFNQE